MQAWIVSKTGVGVLSAALATVLAFPAGYLAASHDAPLVDPKPNAAAVNAKQAGSAQFAETSDGALDQMEQNAAYAVDLAARLPAEESEPVRAVTSTRRVDTEIDQGLRHSIEINEMLCKQTGQNCAEAKLFRRQYNESHGR